MTSIRGGKNIASVLYGSHNPFRGDLVCDKCDYKFQMVYRRPFGIPGEKSKVAQLLLWYCTARKYRDRCAHREGSLHKVPDIGSDLNSPLESKRLPLYVRIGEPLWGPEYGSDWFTASFQ
jgi:hypothetical protein